MGRAVNGGRWGLVCLVEHLVEWRVVLVLAAAHHFEAVLVEVDGEGGLGFEDEDVAPFGVGGGCLDGVEVDHDAVFAVGGDEELGAEAVVDGLGGFEGFEGGAVAEEEQGFGFAFGGEADDVEDGDELWVGGEEADAAVGEGAVVPGFFDGEGVGLEALGEAVLEAVVVEAAAGEVALVVVFDEGAFHTAVVVGGGDVALSDEAFPPASVAVAVEPVGGFGGVARGGVDDVETFFDAHIVGGFLDEVAVGGEELPLAVAVALVVGAAGEEATLLIIGFVGADAAWSGEGVADADSAVGVVVGEGASLKAVDEVAFKDFGAVFVGTHPVALSATLVVHLVLSRGGAEDEQAGCGKEEVVSFHGLGVGVGVRRHTGCGRIICLRNEVLCFFISLGDKKCVILQRDWG